MAGTWWKQGLRVLAWGALATSATAMMAWPEVAPGALLVALVLTGIPLWQAWHGARGTALRPAIAWMAAAIGLGGLALAVAIGEPLATGRPWAGHLAYLSSLCSLAALTTVLNARRPGAAAWAILMGLLVLVLLIPWLEGSGLVHGRTMASRLRLEPPWSLFYAGLVLVGVGNYLPTRFGGAALLLGLGLAVVWLGLTHPGWPPERRAWLWVAGPGLTVVAVWTAEAIACRNRKAHSDLDRLWLWFRDRWGVVWALRVQERFQGVAEASGWPLRLTWSGTVPVVEKPGASRPDDSEDPAVATLMALLRRFADAPRLQAEARASGPCDDGPLAPS